MPVATTSRIARVVVHARGAVVTRIVSVPPELPGESFELAIPSITPLAEPSSFRALAQGAREVVSVAARVVVPDGPVAKGAATLRIRALHNERARLDDERSHAVGRRNLLAGLSFDLGMNRRFRPTDPRSRIQDALAAARLAQDELAALDARVNEIDAALERAQRAIAAEELAAAQANTAERLGTSRPTLQCNVLVGAGQGSISSLEIEYVVLAARWWPMYKAWFEKGATRVRLELDALVAQDSGEDWSDVEIALSTADLVHDARLPELASLRLGRAQPPQKRGYRPPPAGLDAMFESYENAMATLPCPAKPAAEAAPAQAAPPPPPRSAPLDIEQLRGAPPPAPSFGAPGGLPPEMLQQSMAMPRAAMPMPMAAPAPQAPSPKGGAVKKEKSRLPFARAAEATRGGFGGGGVADMLDEGGVFEPDLPPPPIEPDDTWLDFDALVLAGPEDKHHRGRLSRVPQDASRRDAGRAQQRVDSLEDPARTKDPFVTRGLFDHHYEAEAKADVPSNARPHRVHVAAKEGPAKARFRCVPRESTDVHRESRIENPFGAPLLAGPVDVFLDGALVTTTDLGAVDRGGFVEVGLGVEDRLRVARNARVEESTAGLLGGSAVIDHQVTVDLSSSLGLPVQIEVLERIPVTDDKDVAISLTSAEPKPEVYDQSDVGSPVRGGRRFRVEVPAGGKAKIAYAYRVKLPAKSEIVGGNRRE